MARFLKPLVRSGGYYPSRRWTPLVYPGGYTTANGGEEPTPPPIEKTITGNPIHILDALAKPAQALSVKLEPVQDLHGYSYPWPAGGGKNLLWLNNGIFKTGAFTNTTPRETTGVGTWVGMTSSNYLAANSIVSYTIGDNSLTVKSSANGYGVGFECKVTAGQKYTLSWVGTNAYVGVAFYDSNGEYLSYVTSGASPKTFTAPESTENVIIVLRGDAANVTGEFSNVQLEEGQTATAYSPYANICPISGFTGVNVYHSGADTSDATTYSITFPAAAGTVYGGTVDVTTGKLTVDRAIVDLGAKNWYLLTAAGRTRFRTSITDIERISSQNIVAPMLCSKYPTKTANQTYQGTTGVSLQKYSADICIYDPQTESMTTAEFKSAMSGVQLCYKLSTPIVYDLTPTQIELFAGENNIWSDGEMTLTYLADGNASDEEALNILLGGRYVNNHSEDEPTDREALNIVLGGNER